MPSPKKSLTKPSQWTLILVGGLCLIYVGTNWQDWSQNKSSQTAAAVLISADTDILEIPSLNLTAPVIYSKETREAGIQKELQSGVVHMNATAMPGEVGNSYIVGHSSNYAHAPGNYNEIFKNLPSLKLGDTISIIQGKNQFDYIVTDTQVVESTELWVMSQATDGEKILTLQTSYPVGTAQKRLVVISKLKD